MGREESTAQAKAAAREKETAAHAKKVAQKDKQWDIGAKDTSKDAEAAARAAEKAAAKKAAQLAEEKELGGVKTVRQNPSAGSKASGSKAPAAGGSKYGNIKLA